LLFRSDVTRTKFSGGNAPLDSKWTQSWLHRCCQSWDRDRVLCPDFGQNQALFDVVQALGCLFLLYLAFKLIRLTDTAEENIDNVVAMTSHWHAFRDGLLIALISPKIMVFFTALFSQFVRVESGIGEKLGLAVVAGVVDVLWYLFIATLVTGSTSTEFFNRNGRWMNLLFGMILAIFALRFLGQIIGIW